MPFFERPGASLHFEKIENLAPIPTIFVHGNLSSNLWWQPLVDILKTKPEGRAPIFLFEWRGCGKSHEIESISFGELVDDLVTFAESLRLPSFCLVGHSTGGLLSLHALVKRPDLFSRAFLLAPASPEGIPMSEARRELFLKMGKDRNFCREIILGTIQGGNLSPDFKEKVVETAFHAHPLVHQKVPEFLGVAHPLASKPLKPVTIVHGQLDVVLDIEQSRRLALEISAHFIDLPHRGHSPNLEDPPLMEELLRNFWFQNETT